MDRITEKQLGSLVAYLNKITNSPADYSDRETGHFRAHIGHYCLAGAYGGVQLQRVCNEGGGVSEPLGGGYGTKRELYEKIHAFIRGIEEGKAIK
jgi:hypothetical protein